MNAVERKRILALEKRRQNLPTPSRLGRLKLGILYPQEYGVAMSGLGVHFLYRIFSRWDFASVDRFFKSEGRGVPRSLELGWRLSNLHVLAATLPYEEDYASFLSMLVASGVEPLAEEREGQDPVVIVGGPAIAANPEPMARIYDIAVLGDGEVVLDAMRPLLEEFSLGRSGREELLESVRSIPGVYVPRLGREGVMAAPPADLGSGGAASAFVTPLTHFADTALIEIARGCTSRCRFCLATQVYRTMRPVPEEFVLRELESWRGVAKKIGFVSVSLTDHPRFADLLLEAQRSKFEISLSSLRVDSVTDREIEIFSEIGIETLTLAPETGSDRLRRSVRKKVTNDRILEIADLLGESPIQTLKLYFMFGLPTETDEDLLAIGELAEALRARLARGKRPTKLALSVNPLMAKPQTPFQFFGLERKRELRRKARLLARGVGRNARMSVDLKGIQSALDQTAIALGDDRVGPALLRSLENATSISEAMLSEGIDYERLVHSEKGIDHIFPWDFYVGSSRKEAFHREFLRSFEEAEPGLEFPLHLRRARRAGNETLSSKP